MRSAAANDFGDELRRRGLATDLMVAGSLATGDYVPGVSDLDLVALVDGPVRTAEVVRLHRQVDQSETKNLGCVYVDVRAGLEGKHPTWTHGRLVDRILSGITRAELVRHGYAIFGREPREVFPAVTADDIRAAARAELTGYWAWAARRPWIWLDPGLADLGLTSMARARHALADGDLLTKTRAIDQVRAPAWLRSELAARRQGREVGSPRWRTGWIAWRDTRRTVAEWP
ncbi:nucleotidyltransferase domain-containing protein [Actinoplanes sp. NPDC049596]|uniref:nucleotidyltransferase domain-containing protein n=1 Tax=unclassified Actinoplanes TaxID=2626549 RepID=UPI0034132675